MKKFLSVAKIKASCGKFGKKLSGILWEMFTQNCPFIEKMLFVKTKTQNFWSCLFWILHDFCIYSKY